MIRPLDLKAKQGFHRFRLFVAKPSEFSKSLSLEFKWPFFTFCIIYHRNSQLMENEECGLSSHSVLLLQIMQNSKRLIEMQILTNIVIKNIKCNRIQNYSPYKYS